MTKHGQFKSLEYASRQCDACMRIDFVNNLPFNNWLLKDYSGLEKVLVAINVNIIVNVLNVFNPMTIFTTNMIRTS